MKKKIWEATPLSSFFYVDFVTFIVQSYFDTLLHYILSVTFHGAAVLKVTDQKTLVKSR